MMGGGGYAAFKGEDVLMCWPDPATASTDMVQAGRITTALLVKLQG